MAETVVWSRRALAQLDEIVAFVSQDSPGAAERLRERLLRAGDSLAEFPDRGRAISRRVRQLVHIRPYLITYQVDVSPIRVPQVRHGARRPL